MMLRELRKDDELSNRLDRNAAEQKERFDNVGDRFDKVDKRLDKTEAEQKERFDRNEAMWNIIVDKIDNLSKPPSSDGFGVQKQIDTLTEELKNLRLAVNDLADQQKRRND